MASGTWIEPLPGISYCDLKASGGPAADLGDRIVLLYAVAESEAALDAGECIASTLDPPRHFETVLDDAHLLPGLVHAIRDMQAGGSLRRVRLAPEWAYGARGYGSEVEPNQELVFDLILSTVEKG